MITKNIRNKYLRSFGGIVGIGFLLSWLIFLKYPSEEMALILVIAPVVTSLNALVGMFLISKSVGRSQSTFLKLVLGGMLVRLLCLGVIIALIYIFIKLHFLTFIIILMVYYFALLILEVVFLHTQANRIMATGNTEKQ